MIYAHLRTSAGSLTVSFLQSNVDLLNIIFLFAQIAATGLTGTYHYLLPSPVMPTRKQWKIMRLRLWGINLSKQY